jgi:hypothetical protein
VDKLKTINSPVEKSGTAHHDPPKAETPIMARDCLSTAKKWHSSIPSTKAPRTLPAMAPFPLIYPKSPGAITMIVEHSSLLEYIYATNYPTIPMHTTHSTLKTHSLKIDPSENLDSFTHQASGSCPKKIN